MKLIDISLPIHPKMPIYPGNQLTEFTPIVKPSGSRLTTVTIDSHAGTHIDGPSHSLASGGPVSEFPLDRFYGPCRVLDLLHVSELITADDLKEKSIQPGERILFKTTNSTRGYDQFYENWVALSSDGAAYLAQCDVALVGIDWFGIKQKGAPDNGAHTALLEKGIPILEGIDLTKADEGEYILSAFPIAYQGTDGAPARAVLIKSD